MSNELLAVLNGGQRPGDASQEVLWDAFKDCALFAVLKLALNPEVEFNKESVKADILERWEEQARLDFSRQLEETRHELADGGMEKYLAMGIQPDLGRVEAEFDIQLTKVRGMAIRVLDLL